MGKCRQELGKKGPGNFQVCLNTHKEQNYSIFIIIPRSSISLPPRHQQAVGTPPFKLCTSAEEQTYLGCLLRHHYMSVWHHLFPMEEPVPGQVQQFEQTIHQVGAGGRGGIRNCSQRSTKRKWMEVGK